MQLQFPGEFRISLSPPAVLVTFREDSSREGWFLKTEIQMESSSSFLM